MSASSETESHESASSPDAGEGRTVALLQKIQSGAVDPKCIASADRRQVVAVLMADGYATPEIAQVLKVSDRSIERDKAALRQANAIVQDPKLVPRMVGRLVGEAELSVQRIRKATRDKTVPAAVKVDAEHRCYQIVSDLVQRMQGLGYLPIAAQRMEADLTHHLGETPDFGQLLTETERLRLITQQALPSGDGEAADGGELVERLTHLQEQISRARLASEVDSLSSEIDADGQWNAGDEAE